MKTGYPEAIAELFALQSRGIRMGVKRMSDALSFRGDPDAGMRLIHVAGTNGKGSVSTMLASCLQRAGYRTGLFTSPHLHRWVERIRIDGRPLSEAEAARRIRGVLSAFDAPDAPESTFFELTTLIAIEAFRDRRCDVAVMEVGLGGRLDATNATTPELCVITRVALDHTRILGDTVAEIAREKAGIIKAGVPVVIGNCPPEATAVIRAHARRKRAPVRALGRDFRVVPGAGRRFGVELGQRTLEDIALSLPGAHQRDNAACTIAALDWLAERGVCDALAAAPQGPARARWAGRLETIGRAPRIVVDAAHNEDGCEALAAYLQGLSGITGKRILVFGCMRDKAIGPMLRRLRAGFDRILYCPPAMPRAAPTSMLQRLARGDRTAGVADAVGRARKLAGRDGLVVVAGSIFLVAEARAHVLGVRSDPLIRM